MKKILAIQGSPKGSGGNTDLILQEFLSGARSKGARTEMVYLKKINIGHCTGCYGCWVKTPGKCVLKDDMANLLEQIRLCDLLVLATPVYVYSMTSLMKAFIDRMLPLVEPHFVKEGNCYKHPSRYNRKYNTVLISNCGLPDMKQFDALRHNFRLREEFGHSILVGELLMPAGVLLKVEGLKDLLADHYKAFFQAGVEVVEKGRILPETEQAVQKLIFNPEDFYAMANRIWDEKLAAAGN